MPTFTASITATNDDGRNFAPVTGADSWTNNDVSVGTKNSIGDDKAIGLRFLNITISRLATILTAKITFVCKITATGGSKEARIYGGNYDNFNGFSDNALPEDAGTPNTHGIDLTTNFISWTFSNMTAENSYDSPDLTAVVQEIIDRPNWASGNAMAFAIRPWTAGGGVNNWSKDFYDYSTDSTKVAILTITYNGPNEDIKPGLAQIINSKPQAKQIMDIKPQLSKLQGVLTQSYQVIINTNQYMGLPYLLTYKDAGTMIQFSEKGLDH